MSEAQDIYTNVIRGLSPAERLRLATIILENLTETDLTLVERTDRIESEMISAALKRFHWNKTETAEHMGLKRTTLQYKIKKYGLE